MVIIPGEKTPQSYIGLDEVVVYQPVKLNSFEEMKKYMLLRRRVLKVYPMHNWPRSDSQLSKNV